VGRLVYVRVFRRIKEEENNRSRSEIWIGGNPVEQAELSSRTAESRPGSIFASSGVSSRLPAGPGHASSSLTPRSLTTALPNLYVQGGSGEVRKGLSLI
jgi:hypothetical protein